MVEPPPIYATLMTPPTLKATLSANQLTAKLSAITGRVGIPSDPPAGQKQITNMYWNPSTQEVVLVTED
jgi:hypothetical protein